MSPRQPARPTRRSPTHPGRTRRAAQRTRPPSLRSAFASALRDARGTWLHPDPLPVEMLASGLAAVWRPDPLADDEREEAFGGGLVSYLAEARTPDAMALLHALASVAGGTVSEQARFAARRLNGEGIADPAWAAQIGRPVFVEAWTSGDEFGDQDLVIASFEYPGRGPHAMVVMPDHNFHGLIRDAWIGQDPQRVRDQWAAHSGTTVASIDAQAYADVLANGLHWYDTYLDPPIHDNVPPLVPLLRARLRTLPAPHPIEVPEVTERARRAMVTAFRKSPEAAGMADADLAADFVNFACDYGSGDPLRWSPIAIEICLLDWFPRKITMDDGMAAGVPEAMRRWVRYAGRRKGLPDASMAESLAAIDQFEPQFREHMADPATFGPAKALVREMLADGVDMTDEAAVQAWVEEWNRRPR